MSRRCRGTVGATLVEAAFALPIFFLLFLGLIDFGLLAFNSNQVANAARDGARVGILHYSSADDASSADRDMIKDAILAKLPGGELETLEISCRQADGSVIDCHDPSAPADPSKNANPDTDFIHVKVEWTYDFISPVARALGFTSRTVTGEAQMALVGQPSAVTPAATTTTMPDCEVSGISVSPGASDADRVPVKTENPQKGSLGSNLAIFVSTNGSPKCTSLVLELRGPDYAADPSKNSTTLESCACEATYTYTSGPPNPDTYWLDETDPKDDGLIVVLEGSTIVEQTIIYLDHG